MFSGDPGIKLRVASALALMPVALGMVILGDWPFACLVGLAVLLMALEWRGLTKARFDRPCGNLAAGATGALALIVVALAASGHPGQALIAVIVGALLVAVLARYLDMPPLWLGLGAAYLVTPALALIWLRGLPQIGWQTVIWLLAVVWTTDVFAYLVGRAAGGPRLAPQISPGKTWSGLCGGVLAAAVAGGVAATATGSERLLHAAGLGGLLAVVSQVGDLIESALKRRAGVKDSGSLIPGHGGVLDRMDGLMLAAPVLALLLLAGGPGMLLWR